MSTKITTRDEAALVENTAVAEGGVHPRVVEGTEDWRRAFALLALTHSRGWNGSLVAEKNIAALQEAGHEEAAKLYAEVWEKARTPWMQDFMG